MKKILVAALILLTGCGATEVNTEVVTTEALTTEDISTEVVTTDEPTTISTEAPKGKSKEIEFEIGEMTSEEDYILLEIEPVNTTTEQSTGEIDVDGYGWVQLQYDEPYHIMDNHLTRSNGSIRVFGHRETWYSTNEACGVVTARDIPGKHVAKDGTIRDEDGYICVASSDLKFYSIVMTSVGPGKVYDCGCSSGTVDVYTNW